MTTSFAAYELEMDFPHLDDKMEIGNSPYLQADDIELDFDNVRQQSVDRSMADEIETGGHDADLMQAEVEEVYNDDDMIDDETMQAVYGDQDEFEDLNMESYDDLDLPKHEDEIADDTGEDPFVEMTTQRDLALAEKISPKPHEVDAQLEEIEEPAVHDADERQVLDNAVSPAEQGSADPSINEQSQSAPDAQTLPPVAAVETGDSTEVVDFATEEAVEFSLDVPEHDRTGAMQEAVSDDLSAEKAEQGHTDTRSYEERGLGSPPQPLAETTAQQEAVVESKMETRITEAQETTNQSVGQLHPITIVYLGQEMSLFPPMVDDTSATFFVSEPSLVHEPVEKLLASCRDILGGSLEHDDELVLDVPALGLHICEDSKYASQLTLSQVVDVYLALSHNENIENVEPLYCSLSSRVCLASQYAYLAASAGEGKTYSDIAADYVDSPGHEEASFDAGPEETTQNELEASTSTDLPHGDQHTPPPPTESASVEGISGSTVNGGDESTAVQGITTTGTSTIFVQNASEKVETAHEPLDPNPIQHDSSANSLVELDTTSDLPSAVTTTEQVTNEDKGGSKAGSQIAEHDEVDHPEASPAASSHTVEGDVAASVPEPPVTSPGHADEQVDAGSDTYEIPEDLFEENVREDSIYNDADELNIQSDPEIKGAANVTAEDQAQGDIENDLYPDPWTLDEINANNANDANELEERTAVDDLDVFALEDDSAVPPVTPSKANGIKRKALEEDEELDFLEFSTPEPKRNRAS